MSVNSKMTAIADAIRAKTGGTDALTLDGMAEAVAGIEAGGGGGGFPNGTEWTRSNVTSGNYVAKYANGLWVAGDNKNSSPTGLWYSTDGMTWTQSNVTSGGIACIEYANGVWVACDAAKYKGCIYYSTNGMTWTQSNVTRDCYKCVNANGVWVAGTRDALVYSTDGMTWTQSNVTGSLSGCGLANANGVWVAGVGSGLWYSTDGMTWTQSNVTSGSLMQVYVYDGLWIAGSSYHGSKIFAYCSTDGMTWTQSDGLQFYEVDSVCKANGLWVAGYSNSSYGSGLWYSTDGMTWTQSNVTSGMFYSITNANGVWVAGGSGYGSSTKIRYSTDGMTWKDGNMATYGGGSEYGNAMWVAGCGYKTRQSSGTGLWYSKAWEPTE